VQGTEDGVVLEKVSESFRIGEVVGGNKLNVRIMKAGANDIPADTAETVNTNFDCHMALFYQRTG
jgi:hypothetical protein